LILSCTYSDHTCYVCYVQQCSLDLFRVNKTKILEYLHDAWAIDRKAEWSIWTVHSKIEIPHRYLRSMNDESSHRHSLLRVSGSRKFHDDVIALAKFYS
jgi:hypothetical protein